MPGVRARISSSPALQEDGAAVEEDDRAEDRGDRVAAGKGRHREVEPVLDHVAVEHDRDREQQREPEAAAEHLDAVAGVLVVTGMWVMVSMASWRDGLMIDVAAVGDVTLVRHVVVVMVRGFGRRGVMIGVSRVIHDSSASWGYA